MVVVEKLKEVWAKLTKGAGSAADKTKGIAGEALGKTKDVAGAAVEKTKEVAGTVVDKTKEVAGKAGTKVEDKVDGPPEAGTPPTDATDGSE
jgi:hyperosmotically inducible periplasmic protein